MRKLPPAKMLLRILIYCLGLATVSLGIVLCKKSALGISPISTVPYSLEQALPLTFGQLTMCFHFVNTALQLVMNKDRKNIWKLLMQVPVAFAFSVVIDWFGEIIRIDSTVLGWQIASLILSVPVAALGLLMMVHMDLFQNPPDGTIKAISLRSGKELGTVKNLYDCSCVVLSIIISLLLYHRIVGFGVATVVSALGVGRCVKLFSGFGRFLDRMVFDNPKP